LKIQALFFVQLKLKSTFTIKKTRYKPETRGQLKHIQGEFLYFPGGVQEWARHLKVELFLGLPIGGVFKNKVIINVCISFAE